MKPDLIPTFLGLACGHVGQLYIPIVPGGELEIRGLAEEAARPTGRVSLEREPETARVRTRRRVESVLEGGCGGCRVCWLAYRSCTVEEGVSDGK